ncbi:hypothetical protein HanHA300_Chr01g0032201 [Helianthus annuus]|nr:hypothetical protein HanHA300_Chr01g0032201 [Helianthus annuus]
MSSFHHQDSLFPLVFPVVTPSVSFATVVIVVAISSHIRFASSPSCIDAIELTLSLNIVIFSPFRSPQRILGWVFLSPSVSLTFMAISATSKWC